MKMQLATCGIVGVLQALAAYFLLQPTPTAVLSITVHPITAIVVIFWLFSPMRRTVFYLLLGVLAANVVSIVVYAATALTITSQTATLQLVAHGAILIFLAIVAQVLPMRDTPIEN